VINEESSSSPQRLYARIWRWHFFAALIVIPFVLWQSVAGEPYRPGEPHTLVVGVEYVL